MPKNHAKAIQLLKQHKINMIAGHPTGRLVGVITAGT
jgi:hypothetical protein